jgi:hypothetical protein
MDHEDSQQQLRGNNIIEKDVGQISVEGVDCIKLLLEMFQLIEYMVTVINLRVT